ncbi:helix-turn-helix domain-containing protein [Neotabrizicola sp. sgz301269]|uniref:helix-turn-helix domain-containing protein n=1 Tax=Neotabrizicola sp. sgz301269 TaxID=3276282 RepID=UPI0037703D17
MAALKIANIENKIGAGAFRVLAQLLDHCNQRTGLCYPSQATLAKALNLTDRQVRNHVRSLETVGYLRTLHGQGPNGCNRYELLILDRNISVDRPEVTSAKSRKFASDKSYKNPEKKQRHVPEPRIPLRSKRVFDAHAAKQNAKKEGELEQVLVERLGGGQNGWAKLVSLPEAPLIDWKRKFAEGQMTIGEVVDLALAQLGNM